MSSTSGTGEQGKGDGMMLQITQLLTTATTSLDAQVKELKAENQLLRVQALEKDKALEASQQQVKTLQLDLEKVRKEKGELTVQWFKAQDKIVQMRNELAEQDGTLLDMRRRLSAIDEDSEVGVGSGLGNGSRWSQDIKAMVLAADVPSRPSAGNVEHEASLEEGAGAGGQSEDTGQSVENGGPSQPATQTEAEEEAADDRTKKSVPGPSSQTTPSISTPCRIPRRGVRNVDEVTAAAGRMKREKDDDEHEVLLKHKKAPRTKANDMLGLGVYSCICGKTYGRPGSLKDHFKYYAKKDVECNKEHGKGSKANSIRCSLCFKYLPRSELLEHQRAQHLVDLTSDDHGPKNDQQCSNKDMKRKKKSSPSPHMATRSKDRCMTRLSMMKAARNKLT